MAMLIERGFEIGVEVRETDLDLLYHLLDVRQISCRGFDARVLNVVEKVQPSCVVAVVIEIDSYVCEVMMPLSL
jgi:hypothetical protein